MTPFCYSRQVKRGVLFE